MKLNDIHFCLGFVLGKRDKFFSKFILDLKDLFTEEDYNRQEIQKILYNYYINSNIRLLRWEPFHINESKRRCYRFIKHVIRNHKNY